MGERERILELVREGIITVDEGLDLLESLANKETQETEKREFSTGQSDRKPVEPVTEKPTETEDETEQTAEDKETMKKYEDELENLANEITRYSVEIDAINEELTTLKAELSDAEDKAYKEWVFFKKYANAMEGLKDEKTR